MRIRTQFILTLLLFVAVLATASTSMMITNQKVQAASEQKTIAGNILQGASELSYLANDYIIYQDSHQLEVWQSRFTSFSRDVASLNVNSPEEQMIARDIKGNAESLNTVFGSVVSAVANGQTQGGTVDQALLQTSWSRISVQTLGLISSTSRLSQLLDTEVSQLGRLHIALTLLLIGVVVAYLLLNLLTTQRKTIRGLARLQAGAVVIGSGNLGFKIEEKGKDEIGDLSRAFNRMTSDLKEVTASKTELEAEVATRKKAEEELKAYQQHLAELVAERTRELSQANEALKTEVAERKRAEEEVTAERQRFREVLDMLPAYLLLLSADYHVPFANRFFRERFGESHGKRCFEYLFNRTEPCENCETYTVMKTNAPHHWEWLGPDGHNYDIYDFPFTDVDGSHLVMETGIDITKRKQAEQALRQSQDELEKRVQERTRELAETRDYLDNLFNYANDPIIVWNPDFEITRFNHAFERLTGLSAAEVIGQKLDILFPERSRESSMELIRQTSLGQRWETVEIPVKHQDGSVRIVLWNSATVFAPESKLAVATIAQGHDITLRKQAEEELRRSNAELQASNRELEAFSYSVSHDLRAPLRSMEGFSSALIEDYADRLDEKGKQYLKYVQDSSELMSRLIDDLLKLSRVTRSEMNYDRVDLGEISRKIIDDLRKSEPDRKVRLEIGAELTVYGDRNLLRLALENLLGNAWKFSAKTAETRIEIGSIENNGRRAYFVRDNGVGFDMKYADKLFKPFQRLHKATDFSGTGIGLATVQRIIRRHGGDIRAESKVGEGAVFYFTLA